MFRKWSHTRNWIHSHSNIPLQVTEASVESRIHFLIPSVALNMLVRNVYCDMVSFFLQLEGRSVVLWVLLVWNYFFLILLDHALVPKHCEKQCAKLVSFLKKPRICSHTCCSEFIESKQNVFNYKIWIWVLHKHPMLLEGAFFLGGPSPSSWLVFCSETLLPSFWCQSCWFQSSSCRSSWSDSVAPLIECPDANPPDALLVVSSLSLIETYWDQSSFGCSLLLTAGRRMLFNAVQPTALEYHQAVSLELALKRMRHEALGLHFQGAAPKARFWMATHMIARPC